jgi:hypothetical protein
MNSGDDCVSESVQGRTEVVRGDEKDIGAMLATLSCHIRLCVRAYTGNSGRREQEKVSGVH